MRREGDAGRPGRRGSGLAWGLVVGGLALAALALIAWVVLIGGTGSRPNPAITLDLPAPPTPDIPRLPQDPVLPPVEPPLPTPSPG